MNSDIGKLFSNGDGLPMPGAPSLTDFEEALSGPDGETVKKAALERLDRLLLVAERTKGAGISRQAYGDLEKISVGIQAARDFLNKVAVTAL